MRIFAIDPGKTLGWASISQHDGRLSYGSQRFGDNDLGVRLSRLSEWLSEKLPGFDCLVVEHPVIRHMTAALPLHAMYGEILRVASDLGIPTRPVYPTTLKKMLTGSGKAKKTDVTRAVNDRWGTRLGPKSHDVADAIGLLTIELDRSGIGNHES